MAIHVLVVSESGATAKAPEGWLELGEISIEHSAIEFVPGELTDRLARHGNDVVGLWHTVDPEEPDLVLVSGELDEDDAVGLVEGVGFYLLDYRRLVVGVGPEDPTAWIGEYSVVGDDDTVLARLVTASLGPEVRPCPKCGGYSGLHFQPPPLPH